MSNLKIEFQKPKLTLCNTNYTPLGILTNKTHMSAYNITLTSKVNETPSLSFDIPLGGLIDNNSTELLVKHKNDYFVIKNISVTSGDTSSVTVNAEHIACELKGIVVSYFEDLIGESPENMWETVITNCSMPEVIRSRYIFETNIVDTYRYLSGEDEKSIYEHLIDIAEQFEACLLFATDADGKIHIKLLYGDIDRGKFIRKGKDLKQLNLNFSTDSLFTKVTPLGATDDNGLELTIMDLNNGKSYITNYDYYLAKGMTAEEIQNNPLCNQECIYRNTDIIDAEELLRLGQQELDKLSKPIVSGTIEAIDLNVFEGSLYLSPILCEKIIVIDKDINYSISCKITEIEFTYDNPLESKIGISNVVKYSTALKDLVQNSEAISEILTNGLNGRPNLNASKVKGLIDGHIAQLKYSMENSITDVTDAVILFENRIEGNNELFGALAIGSRGILISRELDPITNQWVWTTALDAHGLSTQVVNAIEINASQIKGDILSSYDNSTWINLNNGEFNFKDKIKFVNNEFRIALNSGGTLEDFVTQYEKDKQDMTNDINGVAQEVTNIKDNIDIVISDGVITKAEIVSIEKSIMQLQKEKVDIDTRYTSMVNNSYLNSELKSKLTSSYNNYTKAHNDFVGFIQNIIVDKEITEQERADLDTYSSNYNTTSATLKTNMDTCLSNIAENNTAYQINKLKTKIDSDFKDVNNRLDAIINDVGGVVVDGIIEEAEVLIIQNSIKQLDKEKEDVDMIYNTLYNNNDVPIDIKSNLKTKYDEYVSIHRNLISFINNMAADRVATESEKNTFNYLSNNYSTKLAEFKNATNLALVMANKNYTDTQFNVLDDKIEMRVTSQEVTTIVNGAVEESKAYSDTLFEDFQEQIDGVIETYYQSTDPSTSWTTNELKAKHTGDIWYDNLNNTIYRWSGTGWQKLTDAEAEQAYTLATSKAKVFTSQPTTPYKKGDLWVQGSSGDIMRCIYTRASGNYSSSDWEKASKYTDDTKANEVASDLANNYYTITQTDSAIEVAKQSIELGVKSTITNLEIGGRNLIRNSAFVNGTSCWSLASNVTLDTSRTFNGHPTIKDSQSGLTNEQWRGCSNGHLPIYNNPLTVGQTYTLSCYYYVENTSTFDSIIGLEVKGRKSGEDFDRIIGQVLVSQDNLVSNKWTKVVTTFTQTEEFTNPYVYAWVGKNGTAWFADFKLEKGDKCTDWSVAPEDVDDNLADNYYTKTETESKIKVASDNITSTVSNTYVTKDAFNNTTSTLATKSELTQTSNSITAKFSLQGDNLLRNGRPRSSLREWGMTWGQGNSGNKKLYSGGCNWEGEYFNSGIWWWGSFPTSNWCCLVNYSLSNYKFNTRKTYSVSTIIYNSKGTKQVTIRICDVNGINIVTQQTFSITSGYQYVNFEFTPQRGGNNPHLMFYLETTGDYEFYIPWAVVKEGATTKTWIPNGDEIEEGITTIDKNGITVRHSDVNSVSKMTASGFYIEDGNGETIASLSSKKQWTELKADKVFAKNIENVYQGNLNLYVDHSNTRVGDGTSSNPFSDFASLVDYLEATPIIKKSITINVVSKGNVSDNLYLQNLSGGAEIRFRVNRNLILNGNGANSAFYFYNCDNHIIVNGGRASYDSSDGALINKFKYGVFFNRCKYGVVEYIAIDTSGTGNEQWGVLFRQTNGETRRVDFTNTPSAVFADMGSNVSDNDSCGNCTNAFFSQNGSNIIFGSNVDSGYRPNGAFKKNKGNVVDLGNRTAKASFRNPPPKPATSNQYKDFSFSDYGYYSEGYGNWNSIGYKTIYQGDWGYGNNRGIFTLPNSSISSFLSGGTVLDGNQITLQRENAGGYSASQTIYLWGTTQTSASGSAPPLTKSYGSIGSLAWGEKKTFTLPKAFVQDLKSGTIKSVMFYTSDGSNYVKFSAVCTLRLKVNK